MKEIIYIFWTCLSKSEAKKIVGILLEKRLIACASILPEVESMYRWAEEVKESFEVKVILKTTANLFESVQETILRLCSYEVPEILQLNVSKGNPSYIEWIIQETSI